MARIVIRTDLPIGMPLDTALKAARLQAMEQISLQIAEQHTEPAQPLIVNKNGDTVSSPNDGTDARVLVTQWDYLK